MHTPSAGVLVLGPCQMNIVYIFSGFFKIVFSTPSIDPTNSVCIKNDSDLIFSTELLVLGVSTYARKWKCSLHFKIVSHFEYKSDKLSIKS